MIRIPPIELQNRCTNCNQSIRLVAHIALGISRASRSDGNGFSGIDDLAPSSTAQQQPAGIVVTGTRGNQGDAPSHSDNSMFSRSIPGDGQHQSHQPSHPLDLNFDIAEIASSMVHNDRPSNFPSRFWRDASFSGVDNTFSSSESPLSGLPNSRIIDMNVNSNPPNFFNGDPVQTNQAQNPHYNTPQQRSFYEGYSHITAESIPSNFGTFSTSPSTSTEATLFNCTEEGCSRSYKRKYDLERHQRSHLPVRMLHCRFPDCKFSRDRGFDRQDHLSNHLEKIHHVSA